MRITAVTCVKNEGPFLLEWIAYNRLIGVTDFLFYSNDCTDGTDDLLNALSHAGLITHLPNPAQGRNYQMEALKAAETHPLVAMADWVWVTDVDEFLNIHVGEKTIPALIEACDNPHAISVCFQFFGNCGVETFVDVPVIEQFDRSHIPDLWRDQTEIEVKTLTRHDFPLRYFGAHRPFMKPRQTKNQDIRWVDGGGRNVPMPFRAAEQTEVTRRIPAQGSRTFATLNHYALRSLDSYLVKMDRGDVNRENREFGLRYWHDRNDDGYLDTRIQIWSERLRAEINALAQLPNIKDLHLACVAAHRAARDRLMADPELQNLAQDLRTCPTVPQCELDLIEELGL